MDKLLLFPGRTDQGIFTYVIDAERNYLEKTAAEYHPTIASYINSAKPIKGKTQILLTALGAQEWWGANANSDAFPETALAHEGTDYGYQTFKEYAKLYKHHINKNPGAAYGDVALSVYNPVFHRVELIVLIDHAAAPDIIERVNSGESLDFSMACHVPYDICSICGNKAATRKQYCDHARYMLGKIDPATGKQVYVINTMPKFFDISYVLIGADRIAKSLRKVASATPWQRTASGLSVPGSALLAEKMAASDKEATIDKEVPANEANPPASTESIRDLVEGISELKAKEKTLPRETLDHLARYPLQQSMTTLSMMGIAPKPQEFQRIVLIQMGHRPLADDLWKRNECFDPNNDVQPSPDDLRTMDIAPRHFSPDLMRLLTPFMEDRSAAYPHLLKRMTIIIKKAGYEPLPKLIKLSDTQGQPDPAADKRNPVGLIPVLMGAAALYWALARKAPAGTLTGLDKVIAEHPGLTAALGVGSAALFNAMAGPRRTGQIAPPVAPDQNDVYHRIEEQRLKPFYKVGAIGPAAKRLFIGIPTAYMVSGVKQKQHELNPYEEEGTVGKTIRKYPDVISGALVADALASLKGKGTAPVLGWTGKQLSRIGPAIKEFAGRSAARFAKAASILEEAGFSDPLLKTASVVPDALTNSLAWSLAGGGANLPGRVLGSVAEQLGLGYLGQLRDKKSKVKQSVPQSK